MGNFLRVRVQLQPEGVVFAAFVRGGVDVQFERLARLQREDPQGGPPSVDLNIVVVSVVDVPHHLLAVDCVELTLEGFKLAFQLHVARLEVLYAHVDVLDELIEVKQGRISRCRCEYREAGRQFEVSELGVTRDLNGVGS